MARRPRTQDGVGVSDLTWPELLPVRRAESDRQTVLFSATHPPWVRDVSREYQSNPITIDAVGKGQSEAATTVEHRSASLSFAELSLFV